MAVRKGEYLLMINILLAIAVLPAVLLIYYVYTKDKVEKEPIGLLISLVIWGALIVFPAAILEKLGSRALSYFAAGGTAKYNLFYCFLIIGCVEEGGKYLVMKYRIWNSPEFNFRFDAIVYAVSIGLGFALFENILYVFQGGFTTGLVRAVTAIPAHAINAVFMGYYFGQAKLCEFYGEKSREKTDLAFGFFVPVFLHGFYDFCAMEGTIFFTVAFMVFVVFMDILAVTRINKSSREDMEV